MMDKHWSPTRPVSKKELRVRRGFRPAEFESVYLQELATDPKIAAFDRIFLADDVATDGSTLLCGALAIRRASVQSQITASTAGLMIKKAVVAEVTRLVS